VRVPGGRGGDDVKGGIIILTPEQMAAAKWRPSEFVLIDGETAWRVQQEHARGQAEACGAFYCLALVGLAVAYGQLFTCASAQVQFVSNHYGSVSIVTSVDAWYLQQAMRGCLP
jgi:hypothetical protein